MTLAGFSQVGSRLISKPLVLTGRWSILILFWEAFRLAVGTWLQVFRSHSDMCFSDVRHWYRMMWLAVPIPIHPMFSGVQFCALCRSVRFFHTTLCKSFVCRCHAGIEKSLLVSWKSWLDGLRSGQARLFQRVLRHFLAFKDGRSANQQAKNCWEWWKMS